jgi:hypothetical protein
MFLAPIPHSQAETQVKPATTPRHLSPERRRLYRRSLSALYADPRIVDQIGGKVYRYPPFLRLVILLGLSLTLWFLLFFASSALLSSL